MLKKEGTSVQPRSHPCTVCIGAEVSANHRGRLQSSDLGTNSSVYPDSGRSWVHTPNWLRWVDIFPRWSPPPKEGSVLIYRIFSWIQEDLRLFISFSPACLRSHGDRWVGVWLDSSLFCALPAVLSLPACSRSPLFILTLTLRKGRGGRGSQLQPRRCLYP